MHQQSDMHDYVINYLETLVGNLTLDILECKFASSWCKQHNSHGLLHRINELLNNNPITFLSNVTNDD